MNAAISTPSRRTRALPTSCSIGLCAALAFAPLFAIAHTAANTAPPGAPIHSDIADVSYRDLSQLTEVKRYPTERTGWLDDLSRYIVKSAQLAVPPGQRLSVTINDVELAGMFEPWRTSRLADVRIVRGTSPPRIGLSFRLESADGSVIKEGDRQLRDINFMNGSLRHRGQTLSYEKDLIDGWMAREFGPAPR